MQKPIKVVIVDDSPTMRGLIAATMRSAEDIEVVGTAGDPLAARQVIKETSPDVITLDIEMPKMNGLDFLEKLMRLRPTPVIMVSTLTAAGAASSVKALALGAFECIEKPSSGRATAAMLELPNLIRHAAKSRPRGAQPQQIQGGPITLTPNRNVIAIGSSTGGVEALTTILSSFPANCPPTVITQHMPANFTRTFADRLNTVCAPTIAEAVDGESLEIGRVYIAPGGDCHMTIAGPTRSQIRLKDGPLQSGHKPSVDILLTSVAEVCGQYAVGVILTGMGRDGAAGLLAMRKQGARTLGQDEQSSVVYGMPRVAFEIGAVEYQYTLGKIARAALEYCDQERVTSAA